MAELSLVVINESLFSEIEDSFCDICGTFFLIITIFGKNRYLRTLLSCRKR